MCAVRLDKYTRSHTMLAPNERERAANTLHATQPLKEKEKEGVHRLAQNESERRRKRDVHGTWSS